MMFIGIDPGAKGGIGLLGTAFGGIQKEEAIPYSNQVLLEVCQLYQHEAYVFLEKVHAMPGQGVTSMFSFGKSYGYILGVLDAFQMDVTEVDPRTWKKHFGITADKQESIDKVKELYPGVNLLPTSRCRKESDGMAEALLLARYGRDMVWEE